MRVLRTAALVAVAALAGCGGGDDGESGSVEVQLLETNASGLEGTATIVPTEDGEGMVVRVELSPAPDGGNPAHIHNVSCAEYAGMTDFAAQLETVEDTLLDLRDGVSETTLAVTPVGERATGTFSINVHEPSGSFPTVACGDIPAQG
jgi:hypothetical protein